LIPQIFTHSEVRWKKTRRLYVFGGLAVLLLVAAVAVFFILPPLDLLFDKAMSALLKY
jgi:hypothetical protein